MPTSPNRKLVVLDRDGVINVDSDAFIKTPDEWIALPGSFEAIARLNHAGYRKNKKTETKNKKKQEVKQKNKKIN